MASTPNNSREELLTKTDNNRQGTLLTPEFLASNPQEYFLLLTWRSWNPEDSRTDEQILQAQKRAREKLVDLYKQSPAHCARAEKDPTYWETFYITPCHFKE